MEEIEFYNITPETKPSYETDVAKWYLIRKGKHYACWRWDSKKDTRQKKYLITTLDGSAVVKETYQIDGLFTIFGALETTEGR